MNLNNEQPIINTDDEIQNQVAIDKCHKQLCFLLHHFDMIILAVPDVIRHHYWVKYDIGSNDCESLEINYSLKYNVFVVNIHTEYPPRRLRLKATHTIKPSLEEMNVLLDTVKTWCTNHIIIKHKEQQEIELRIFAKDLLNDLITEQEENDKIN